MNVRSTIQRRRTIRNGIAAGALLSFAVLTVGCATPAAGTATVGVVAAATAAVSTSSTQPSGPAAGTTPSSESSTTAPTTSSSGASSSGGDVTALPTFSDDSSVPDPGTRTTVDTVEIDATTAIWLANSCTAIGTLFGALFAVPTLDETAPVEEFRAAYRDYYAALADTLLGMTDRLSQLEPPHIEGGQALHDGYLQYLIELADISASGAIAIDEAPADPHAIADIVEHIQFDTER